MFIFGGNTGQTPEDIQRMRDRAERLRDFGQPRSAPEGMLAIARALMARRMESRAQKGADALFGTLPADMQQEIRHKKTGGLF